MRISTPFANYLPGNSWLHQLDARLKLLLTATFVFAVFTVSTWLGSALCLFLLIAGAALARVPMRRLMRGLSPVLVILAFTFLAHSFSFTPQLGLVSAQAPAPFLTWLPCDDLPVLGALAFSPAGALDGCFFVLRIVVLVSATTLLTLTSSLLRISDAIASLLRPLARLRLPVEDIAMMFSIALRFIPLTAEEAEKLRYALAARGVRFNEGGLIRRLRAYMPMLVPLFVSLFRRADSLALAMDSRCYEGSHRTRLSFERFTVRDLSLTLFLSLALVVWGLAF